MIDWISIILEKAPIIIGVGLGIYFVTRKKKKKKEKPEEEEPIEKGWYFR